MKAAHIENLNLMPKVVYYLKKQLSLILQVIIIPI